MTFSNYFYKQKHFIVTSSVLLLCIAIFLAFPVNYAFQGITLSAVALIITPILYIKIVLKESLAEWGFGKGEFNLHIMMTIIISFIAAISLFFLIHTTTDFSAHYSDLLPAAIFDNFRIFLLFHLTFILFFVILYEIFFRGFILNLFSSKVGWWSVIIQFLIMTIVLFLGYSDHFLLDIPYLLIALFAGIVGYVTHSVWYTIPFAFLYIITINTFIISNL